MVGTPLRGFGYVADPEHPSRLPFRFASSFPRASTRIFLKSGEPVVNMKMLDSALFLHQLESVCNQDWDSEKSRSDEESDWQLRLKLDP